MQLTKLFIGILFMLFSVLALADKTLPSEIASDVVTVKAPRVEMEAADVTSTEVIMQLYNKGKYAHELVAAYSPVAKQVQLHTIIEQNKQPMMEQIGNIRIAPHHERDLQLRGLHVMLIGLSKELIKGELVPITLIFKDGSWLQINVAVS